MKAAVVTGPGARPEYADFPDPVPDEGFELVELVAAGIHPIVRALAGGAHYGATDSWPIVPGVDAVARAADGTLVYTGNVRPPHGTLAERLAVPARFRLPLPEGADPLQLAGGVNPGIASWLPLTARVAELTGASGSSGADERPLGTVLVLGATGVAGDLAVQNALLLGAERIVAAGRDESRLARVADLGATTVALTGDQATDAAGIGAALEGRAPSLVLDFVWGAAAEAVFAALARRGLEEDEADIVHVEIGSAGGAEAGVPAALLRSRRYRLAGSGAGSVPMAEILREIPRYIDLLASGQVAAPVRAMRLSEVAVAWSAGSGERVVLTP